MAIGGARKGEGVRERHASGWVVVSPGQLSHDSFCKETPNWDGRWRSKTASRRVRGGLLTRRENSRPATPAPSDHLGAGGELKRCDHVASAAPRRISTRLRPIRPPRPHAPGRAGKCSAGFAGMLARPGACLAGTCGLDWAQLRARHQKPRASWLLPKGGRLPNYQKARIGCLV